MVRVRDPLTGHCIVDIRDPKIDILPYAENADIIDMQEAIMQQQIPIFNHDDM